MGPIEKSSIILGLITIAVMWKFKKRFKSKSIVDHIDGSPYMIKKDSNGKI